MTYQTPVPSDIDADSFLDLAEDCREVVAVLAALPARVSRLGVSGLGAIGLSGTSVRRVVRVPLARVPLDRLPFSFGAMPADITDDLLVGTVSELDDY